MLPENRKRAIEEKTVFISCVVPVFNEEANAEIFFTALQKYLHTLTSHHLHSK